MIGHGKLKWMWLASSLLTAAAQAFQPVMPFSARAIQQSPHQPERIAQMFVATSGVRMEYERKGQPVVEIYNLADRRAWLLMPEQKIYMERTIPEGVPMTPVSQQHEENPCTRLSNAQCVRLGNETINGQAVVVWEMTGQLEGRPVRSLHWLDRERHMPIRQLWHDGTTFEVVIQGKEELHGRITEKWDLVTTGKDGETHRSYQWYDPELKITVREQIPGGYLRELRDIQVEPQPEALFKVPEGYQRVTMPDGNKMPQKQGQRSPPQADSMNAFEH